METMSNETMDTNVDIGELLDQEPDAPSGAEVDETVNDGLAGQSIEHTLGRHRGHPILPFDFRRPYNISKSFEKNMLTICESFAKSISLSFTSMLRANVSMEHKSLKLSTFGDYVRSLPEISSVATISLAPLAGQSLVLMDIGMSFIIMKRLLGGLIEEETNPRKFTDIEFGVARILIERILDAFGAATEKTVQISPELVGMENNPAYLGTMSNGETVILLEFQIDVDGTTGETVLCIPLTAFEPVWELFSPDESAEYRTIDEVRRDRTRVFDMLQVTTSDVVVNLGEIHMPLSKVLQIKEGDLIPLYKSVNSSLTVEVQGKPLFKGTPGKLHNSRALRITERIDLED